MFNSNEIFKITQAMAVNTDILGEIHTLYLEKNEIERKINSLVTQLLSSEPDSEDL